MIVMSNAIEVAIEGKKYIPLLSLKKDAVGTLDLTTISNRQSRAIIKLFLRTDNRRQLLREIEVSDIHPDRAGVPLIRLQGVYTDQRILAFKVTVNGRFRFQIDIKPKEYVRRRKKWLFLLILLLLGAGIIFSLWLSAKKGKEQQDAQTLQEAAGQPLGKETAQDQNAEAEPAKKDESIKAEPLSAGSVGGKTAEEIRSAKPPVSEPVSEVQADTVQSATSSKQVGAVKPLTGGKPAEPAELKKSTEPTLPENTIYFLPDSSLLTPAAEIKLRSLLPLLLENADLKIEILGHCAPMGSEQGRNILSFERARRVSDFLSASGWKPYLQAKVNGAGSSKAVTRNPEMQHLNRRAEILIISQVN